MKNRSCSSLFSRLPLSYLLLTFLTLFAASIASAQIPSTGLVGYWPFNGNANDESGNGNNGTVNGATLTTDRFGNANSAYSFDGINNYISVADNPVLDNLSSSSFTVSLWFLGGEMAGNQFDGLLSRGWANSDSFFGFQIGRSGNQYNYQTNGPGCGGPIMSITPGSWHNITQVYSLGNGSVESYFDGTLVNVTNGCSNVVSTLNNNFALYFGVEREGSLNFNGLLDDISIHNRALTPAEITQIYTSQTSTVATPPCPTLATNLQTGLVGYWPFCGNANDESGNGNNGTVNGATLTTDRFGNANSAYSFDGVNDFIQTLNPGPTGTGISVSYWYKSIQTTQNIGVIVFGGNSWASYFEVTHNHWASGQGPCNGPGITGGGTLFNPGAYYNPNDNIWHHVVVSLPIGASSFDQTLFYLDGALISNSCSYANYGAPSPNIGSANPIKFGRSWQIAHPSFYQGVLDDISIYNRALTPAEITQLYTDQTSIVEVPCSPFLGEDQTVCAGTSVSLNATSTPGPVAACTTLPLNLQTGLVGYWPFCGNANDASGNGNNGTVNGATLTTDRFGNQNSAYSFSNNLISVPHNESLGIQQNGMQTVSAWINVVGNQSVQHLIGKRPNGAQQFNWQVSFNYPANQGLTYTGNLNFTNTGVVSNFNPQQNIWVHLVCVYNNGVWSIYVNGTLINSVSTGLFYPDVNCPLTFGNAGSFQPFYGTLDEIAIYNRALSLSEIQQLYTLDFNSYLWSTGATTPTINVTPTTTTTYTCTVTDVNGNVCTDSVTVFVPQIEATDLTICAGETTTLSVSGINSTATPSACPTLPTNLQTGLVGYWPFCGNANDASGNGNNGTVNGATLTTDRFGNANSAYAFNVNSLTSIGVSNLNVLNDWSIAFWCNPSNSNTSFLYYPIGINCQLYWKGIGLSGNNPPCGIPGQNLFLFDGSQGCSNWFAANSVFNYNSFNQFVITKSGLEYRIYQNGTLLNSSSSLEAISIQSLTLGRRCNDPSTNTLDGTIDDVILHNRALTINEIQQLYTLGQTTYLWSNGATTPTINVSPTTTTTYTCTVTTNGVSCTDSVTVIVSNPVIGLGADVTICGTSTTLTAPSGYDSYLWSNGGTTNTTTVTANGTYSCTVTQGGCSATDSIDVTLIDATITASDSIVCAGEIVTLSVPQGGSTSTACEALPTNLQTGLVGYWPFCGNANDASGNGNNGTVNGATSTTDRFGNANSAYSFDGVNDFISVPDAPTLSIQGDFTIQAWKFEDPNSTNGYHSIVTKRLVGDWGYNLAVSKIPGTANQELDRIFTGRRNENGAQTEYRWSDLMTSDGIWQQVTVTVSNNIIKFYIDGSDAGNNSLGGNSFTSPAINQLVGVTIGDCNCNNNEEMQGVLDDIGIWNRALTATEIQQLYSLGQSTYLWSNGATTPTINVSPTSTTTYTCTITTNGVSCTDAVTVVVSNPIIDLGADVTVCGTSTTLTAPSGYDTYLWSNGGTTNTTTVTSNGTYSCAVTQGGCSATDSIDVTLVNATVSASDSIICAGEIVTLSVPQAGSTSTACSALPTNLQTGLVGYWPFCGNANDASGNGNNGSVNGAALTTDRFGSANGAYSFDGYNDLIRVPHQPNLNLLGDYSISVWLEGNFQNLFNNSWVLIAKRDDAGTCCSPNVPYDFFIPFNNTNYAVPGMAYANGGYSFATPPNNITVPLAGWQNVIITNSSDNLKFFVNGNLVYTTNFPSSLRLPNTSDLLIGSVNREFGAEWMSGKLDDIGTWSRALTAEEIQQLYTLGQTNYLWSNGATTPTINVSPTSTTTYTCTVTTNGVSCADSVTVVVSQPVASITPNGIVEICQGQSIALTANGGVSYLWNTGAPTQSITVNTEAVYTVTVTDTNGCTDTESQLVKVNFLPNIGVNSASICPGQSTTLTATGGLTYVWSPATGLSSTTGTTVTASPSTSTVYTVTGTGANGCTNTATAAVTVNAAPTATITAATATTFCQGGSVVLNANTGIGLSYQWFNNAVSISGATTSSYTANASGSYTVVVTNTSTCSATSTATVVTVNALPTATITPATATTFCQGGSVMLNANTGAGLSYQWFNNAVAISGATTSSYTANASGSYTVIVTNTSTCSATSAATVVTVNALPTATITPATATTFCQGGSVVLNANTGAGLSYQWFNNAVAISGATSSSYTANASGSYTVVVTNTSTCSATSTATVVTVNALPTATMTAATATTFCQGGSVVLNANTGTGLSYQWFNNAVAISGATTSTYTANASGSYTVVVTNTSTCSATSAATVVTVNALPTATITPVTATTFCQGGSVVLNANTGAGLSYQWFNNTVAISGATTSSYTANASGSYTVVVTNTSTCSATSTATVVTVNALPTATITPATATTFCQGGSVVLNANAGTGLTYQWRLNGTNITGATSSSYTANASGSYTVIVTNTSTCSATSTATVVTVNALPTATMTAATATTFCQGGSVVLNANTGTGLSYQWFNNAVAISGATTSTYTANASGSYTVVVTNTSTCSATSTATVVTVNALPTATITPATATTFCQGGSVVLNANMGTGLTYQWRLNGTNITGATSSSYTANASGSYTVVVTNTSTCSATSTATVVTVNALPSATITPATATTFCQGGSVVLNANTGTGLSYQWFNNAVAISGATTSTYTANASGSYTVVVTNTSTCSATSTPTVVTVNALPTATITPATATTFCQGGSVVLNANTGTGLTYQWRLNGTNITGATSSSYTANANGSYTVVVTNTSTCSATSAATVVTVNALPTATITPATTTTFCQGGSVVLNANTGTGLSYQWYNNAVIISGATSASYTSNASGSYTVVATNTTTCSATSTATVVTVIPNVDYFADADGDGFGDVATLISTCVQPQGYVTDNTDCDDTSADVNPAATEVCNHIDDDCSGSIDDGLVFNTYYADVDADTFGDANNSIYECSQPSGYVTNNTDCNDNNVNQNSSSAEICNGEDDDCDGQIDNGLIFLDYYADLDSDGFGAGTATNSCVDLGAGYVTNNTDCNDNNANQNTASTEICNGEDDDCDGAIDNGITFLDYYADADGDGFGAGDVISSCSDLGAGYVSNNTDCDDSNSNINSSATETCNNIDDNCDGQIDEGVQTVYFIDNDGDTYGNPSVSILACTQPIGYTPDDTDCNDTDANINPGAEDIGGNGIDENCDGEIDNSIFELNASINLYPNPTRSELNIQVNSSIIGSDLYIFDAVGKIVYKQQLLSTQTTISVSNFADGNYVVRVGEVVKRFVVEK